MGIFQKIGRKIDRTLKHLLPRSNPFSGHYEGEIIVQNKRNFNIRWHGIVFYGGFLGQNQLPAYYEGRKIKYWVQLTDDDSSSFGAIFYKKRKH